MRINSLYIAAFGAIKDKTVYFNNTFNVIYGDNEFGKTTIMSFIKMMFYGSERGSQSVSKNLRKKYIPWDGSAMAGSIDFAYSDKKYRLEREFKNSNSTDKITLCDLDLGTRQAVTADVGTKFFGLSSSAFERSVFIGQFGGFEKDSSAEGEINSKLSNIVTTGDESISYEKVYSKLERAKLALKSKRGTAGEYDKNIKRLKELDNTLKTAESSSAHYSQLKQESEQILSEIQTIKKEIPTLKNQLESEQDVRNAQKYKEMLLLKDKLDNINESLSLSDGTIIDENYVKKLTFCIGKIRLAENKLNDKISEAKRLEDSIKLAENPETDISEEKALEIQNEIDNKKEEQTELASKSSEIKAQFDKLEKYRLNSLNFKKPINLPLIILSVLLFVSMAVSIAASTVSLAVVLGIIAVILMVSGIIIKPQDKKQIIKTDNEMVILKKQITNMQDNENKIYNDILALNSRYEAINMALNKSTALTDHQKTLLEECNNNIKQIKSELQKECTDLFALYGHYQNSNSVDEIESKLKLLSEQAANQKETKQQLNYIVKDVGNISYDTARQKIESINTQNTQLEDFQDMKKRYESLCSLLTEKTARSAALNAQIESVNALSENPETIKKEIKNLSERATSQEKFCNAAEVAMQVLTQSFGELRSSYGSVLEQKSGEIFKGITSGRYKSMQISNSFEINVEQAGVFGGKELDYLSSGTADQAYLSLRLALSELITQTSEPLPVMLDDALTQYDDTRMKTAIEFLKKYSENSQIIMFTCHKSVSTVAKNTGAVCLDL